LQCTHLNVAYCEEVLIRENYLQLDYKTKPLHEGVSNMYQNYHKLETGYIIKTYVQKQPNLYPYKTDNSFTHPSF